MAKGKKHEVGQLGNKDAEKWTEEKALSIFEECYCRAKQYPEDFCSMDDVILYARDELNLPSRSFYYLIEKFPVLQYFKEDIKRLLTARINKGALQGNYNVTAAIWRMKQLGEKDPDKHQESSNQFANTVFKIITQDVEADSD